MNRSRGPTLGQRTNRPERRRGLHRDAVEALGSRIVRGELGAGTTLPTEAALGAELDVSRTVVREAVKVLAAKGLVVTRPRTGTRVQPRSGWDVLDHDVLDWIVAAGPDRGFYDDLFEVRAILEPRAAELASKRRSRAQADALRASLTAMTAAGDDKAAYIGADLALHALILEASHNELLRRLSATLAVALQAGRDVTTRVGSGPSSSVPLHAEVVAAIVAGEPRLARRSMRALIADATHDMGLVLDGDGPLA